MAGSAIVGTLRAILTADTAEFDAAMKRVGSAAGVMGKDLGKIGRQATALGTSLTQTLTLPLVGIGVGAAKLAIDFESSFAGVRKTVDATEPEFAAMAEAFRGMSKEIPINVNELNRLGEAAGALGTPKAAIADFARVMAMLGVTTNVTSDQAAESIAKIQNIFGAAGVDTEQFASTLVDLGNKGASTELQILEMATRIAGAGNAVGLTQGQVLGFASALSSVGLEAEAGGSAISRVFINIASSVSQGGKDLEGFARVASLSSAELTKAFKDDAVAATAAFAKAFKDDAGAATAAFITGLGNIKASGGDLLGTIDELGFSEIRVRDALLRASGAGDLLTESLKTQKQAWGDNTALSAEAEERFKTTAAQLEVLWNRVKDVGITLGQALMPALSAVIVLAERFVPVVEMLVNWFAAMPEPLQLAALGFLAILAAIGPVLFIAGQLITAAGTVAGAFATGGILAGALTSTVSALGVVGTAFATFISGPIGWITAAVVGLGLIWAVWGDDITAVVKETWQTVKTWLWDKFEPVLTPIIGLLKSIGEMFETFGALVLKSVKETWQSVKTWLWDKFEPVLTPIGGLLTSIGKMFEAFGDLVLEVAKLVIRHVTALYEGVKDWLHDKFRSVIDTTIELYQSLAKKVLAVKDLVVGYAKALYDGVKSWLLDKLKPVIDPAMTLYQSIATKVLAVKDLVVGYAKLLYEGVKSWLLDKFLAVVDAIKGAIDKVAGFFKDLRDKVVAHSYVPELIEGIAREFAKLVTVMVQPTERATDSVKGSFSDTNTEVQGTVGTLLGSIGTWFSQLIPKMVEPTDRATGSVKGAFKSTNTEVQGTVGTLIGSIGTWFGQLGDKMVEPARRAAGEVVGWFEDLSKKAGGWIDDLLGKAREKWPAITGILSGPMELASEFIKGIFKELTDWVSETISGFLSALTQKLVDWLTGKAVDTIVRLAGALANLLFGGSGGVSIGNPPIGGGGPTPPTTPTPPVGGPGVVLPTPPPFGGGGSPPSFSTVPMGTEAVIPLGGLAGGRFGGEVTIIQEQDGRATARYLVPFISGEVKRLQLTR